MTSLGWKRRLWLFVQRFWQPTSACMTCMPGSLGNLMSLGHWEIAAQTGLYTGILALLLSFTPAAALYRNRVGNALIVGGLTFVADAYSHAAARHGIAYVEALQTGAVSFALALAASYLLEGRAQRLRAAWAAWRGSRG